MNRDDLEKAILLAGRVGHLFIATADERGEPHVAVAGAIMLLEGPRVAVSAWFCPKTLENLTANGRIAIIVWDSGGDVGYQLIGSTEKIEDMLMMDGYSPALPEADALPQVERRVVVRVAKVIDFVRTMHSDRERKG